MTSESNESNIKKKAKYWAITKESNNSSTIAEIDQEADYIIIRSPERVKLLLKYNIKKLAGNFLRLFFYSFFTVIVLLLYLLPVILTSPKAFFNIVIYFVGTVIYLVLLIGLPSILIIFIGSIYERKLKSKDRKNLEDSLKRVQQSSVSCDTCLNYSCFECFGMLKEVG